MLIPKGSDKIKLPEKIDHRACALIVYNAGNPEQNPSSIGMVVRQVAMEEYTKRPPKEVFAYPTIFAISLDGDALYVWPLPATELHSVFRYNPAAKQI